MVAEQYVKVAVAVHVRRRDRVRVRDAAGQLVARREGAVARVQQHSAGTAMVAEQYVKVAVAVYIGRCDRARGCDAARQQRCAVIPESKYKSATIEQLIPRPRQRLREAQAPGLGGQGASRG